MIRYKCTVSYDGSAYDGWQSQKLHLSVQEKIEESIERITHRHINIIASGRTDAGVSARAQVFMFDTELEMPERKWMGAINAFLPEDIHIMKVEKVNNRLFHARYNVRWKKYAYRIHTGSYDVFSRNTAWQAPMGLDYERMKEASRYLIGTHDFTTFNSSPLSEYPDQVRTIYDIKMEKADNMITITYTGKGFLRFMVRMMSEALIEVGTHKYEASHIQDMLDAKSKNYPHRNAPACGLMLEEVNYFEILALNDYGMVREYLYGDEIPFGLHLKQVEKAVRDSEDMQVYAFTERHSQKILGCFRVDHAKAVFYVNEKTEKEHALALMDDLQAWLKKKGYQKEIELVVADTQNNA